MDKCEHKIGWLDPVGTMIECRYLDHLQTAKDLVNSYHYSNPDHLQADDVLLTYGWVHITRSILGQPKYQIWWKDRLTEYQKYYLYSYFDEKETNVSFESLCKWEVEQEMSR